MRRIAYILFCHLFGGALAENHSAAGAAFWSHVDDIVGHFYYVEVMFDDEDGVAFIYEFVEHVHKHFDILEVESGSRLVEYIEGVSCVAFSEFSGEFYALCFAS